MKLVLILAALAVVSAVLLSGLPPDAAQLVGVMATLFAVTLKARPQPVRQASR